MKNFEKKIVDFCRNDKMKNFSLSFSFLFMLAAILVSVLNIAVVVKLVMFGICFLMYILDPMLERVRMVDQNVIDKNRLVDIIFSSERVWRNIYMIICLLFCNKLAGIVDTGSDIKDIFIIVVLCMFVLISLSKLSALNFKNNLK
mgnify:FL=1